MAGETLWEGERNSLTAAATGGKVVSEKYRLTPEYIYVERGLLGSKADQYPTWAIRDIDVSSSLVQKARSLSTLKIRLQHDEYTGADHVNLENISGGKPLRDTLNQIANEARLLRQQQSQTVHYSGSAPIAQVPTAPQNTVDPIEQLTKLGDLLSKGLISQEEFDAQKVKLLG